MSIIKDIRDNIKTTLEAIVDGDGTRKIVVVYNYPENNPTGYPYAFIDYKGDISEPLNNIEDLVEYEFDINLIQEKIEDFKGREDAENTTIERSFDINEAFRADNDLSITNVIRVMPIETVKSYVDNATRIALVVKIKVQTKEVITK